MIWRVGRKLGRTLYQQLGAEPSDLDPFVGLMDSPALAKQVVDAVNTVHRPDGQPSAGDLLILKVDRWIEHSEACAAEECSTCDVLFNQLRLAHTVWRASAQKTASVPR